MNRAEKIVEFTKAARKEEAAINWREAEALARKYQEIADKAKEELIAACEEENFEGFGVKVQLVERKGAVDYTQIPELKGVDLEEYRKTGTSYWSVKASVKE